MAPFMAWTTSVTVAPVKTSPSSSSGCPFEGGVSDQHFMTRLLASRRFRPRKRRRPGSGLRPPR
ncbi:MAG: hypothetical protein MZV70_52315 [Desulfobacterales bacterium]|nr:hypothetical protein [Desulfobacterales bacterium]